MPPPSAGSVPSQGERSCCCGCCCCCDKDNDHVTQTMIGLPGRLLQGAPLLLCNDGCTTAGGGLHIGGATRNHTRMVTPPSPEAASSWMDVIIAPPRALHSKPTIHKLPSVACRLCCCPPLCHWTHYQGHPPLPQLPTTPHHQPHQDSRQPLHRQVRTQQDAAAPGVLMHSCKQTGAAPR
jgi:hypothetical protein